MKKFLSMTLLLTAMFLTFSACSSDDDENSNLKDFSIITFKHTIGDKDLGTIGIIGPKRMDYAKVISVMKYISKKLNEDNNKKEGM